MSILTVLLMVLKEIFHNLEKIQYSASAFGSFVFV